MTPTDRAAQVQALLDQLIHRLIHELHYAPDEAARIAETARATYDAIIPRPASEGRHDHPVSPESPPR